MAAGLRGRATRGRRSEKSLADEVPGFWWKARPGDYLLAYYTDDVVWHEMLLCWKFGQVGAVLLSPDGDEYAVRMFGDAVLGPVAVRPVAWRALPEGLGAGVYRFASRLGRAALLAALREGRRLAAEECDGGAEEPACFEEFTNEAGVAEALGDLIGGRGRSRGRPAGSSEDVAGRVPLVDDAGAELADGLWLACEDYGASRVGDEVAPGDVAVAIGRDGLAFGGGEVARVRRCRAGEARAFGQARRRELAAMVASTTPLAAAEGLGFDDGSPPGVGREAFEEPVGGELGGLRQLHGRGGRGGGAEADDDGGELRTMAVDYDAHGRRHKEWRSVVQECRHEDFSDWPIEGPATVLPFITHLERHGRQPSAWLERWCRSKRIEESDRVYYELKTLCDILEHGGSYDQLNLASLASFEIVCRRWQTIIEAYEQNPQKPNFEAAKYFSGMGAPLDGVTTELRTFVARRAREDAEIEKQKQKVRELKKGPAQGGGGAGGK